MTKLEEFRLEIDQIDKTICDLINKRYSLAEQIIKVKGNKFPFDPIRENKLIKKIISFGLDPLIAERIWRQIISSNLAKQKKLKIGVLDTNKYILAAFEIYFGPYYKNYFFEDQNKIFQSLNCKKIDIAFVDKASCGIIDNFENIKVVSNFPQTRKFYNKKFSILINKNN